MKHKLQKLMPHQLQKLIGDINIHKIVTKGNYDDLNPNRRNAEARASQS